MLVASTAAASTRSVALFSVTLWTSFVRPSKCSLPGGTTVTRTRCHHTLVQIRIDETHKTDEMGGKGEEVEITDQVGARARSDSFGSGCATCTVPTDIVKTSGKKKR